MAVAPNSPIMRYLYRLVARGGEGQGDQELLYAYRQRRDEAAFTAIVDRHGPMVLGVCRAVLQQRQDAEDAFQATFLVLTRRANAIRRGESLGSWLHSVAYRVASNALAAKLRRREVEAKVTPQATTWPSDELSWGEVRVALHSELSALPTRFRQPLILCYLEGLTQEEAAKRLGWTVPTVKGRLKRGRALLGRRLEKRSLGFAAVLGATALTGEAWTAPVSWTLTEATLQKAFHTAAAAGSTAALLAQSFLASFFPMKFVVVTGLFLVTVAVAGGLAHFGVGEKSKEQAVVAPKKASANVSQTTPPRTDRYGDPLPDGAIARLGTKRLRHGELVQNVLFSPDGKTLFSWDSQGISVWDAATGLQLRRFGSNEEKRFLAIAFSEDCRFAVVTHSNYGRGQLEVWDAANGKMLRNFPIGAWQRACISPDGNTLAVRTDNSKGKPVILELWDATTGEKRHQLTGHHEEIEDFVFSRDGNTIITSSHDRSIRFWNVATGQQERQLDFSSPVGHVALSADGKTLASVGVTNVTFEQPNGSATMRIPDNYAVLWDLSTGKQIHNLKAPGSKGGQGVAGLTEGVMRIAFTPDSKTLLSSDQRSIYWWNVADGKQVTEHPSTTGTALGISFSPDAKTLAIASRTRVRIGDMTTGKEKPNLGGHEDAVNAVAVSPDGKTIATGGQDRFIRLWDAATGEERRQLGANEHFFQSLTFAPDGKTLISRGYEYSEETKVCVWDVVTGKNLWRFPGTWFALTPDGKTLLTDGKEKSIQIWDMATGREMQHWQALGLGKSALVYADNGKTVSAWCDEDKMIRVWDAVTGKLMRSFPGYGFTKDFHQRAMRHAFSTDGTLAAFSGNTSRGLELYDLTTGKMVQELSDASASGFVSNLIFSPDRRTLVSGDWTPGTIHFWELASGRHYLQFVGHEGRINNMTFSADGSLLLTASDDSTAMVWDFTGRLTGPKKALSDKELEAHWEAFASQDAAHAQQAVRALIALGDRAVAFLGTKVKAAPSPDVARIKKLVSQLDNDDFKVREVAARELETMGDIAARELQVAVDGNVSLELKQRLQRVLKDYSTTQRLRTVRVVQLLEYCATPASRALLERLAEGDALALLTREARVAVKRLRGT
jgi:RNA polymerase sigma factor (sigma-70 family)